MTATRSKAQALPWPSSSAVAAAGPPTPPERYLGSMLASSCSQEGLSSGRLPCADVSAGCCRRALADTDAL